MKNLKNSIKFNLIKLILIFFSTAIISFSSAQSDSIMVVEFQNIQDFDERKYFDLGYYQEIKAFKLDGYYDNTYGYGRYIFCINGNYMYTDCPFGSVDIGPAGFSHPARVIVPINLISQAILRYNREVDFSMPISSVLEILPEIKTIVDNLYHKAIFTTKIASISLYYDFPENEVKFIQKNSCFEKFPHIFLADIKTEISSFFGKDVFLTVRFSIPLTIDFLSWIPDIRYIEGEIPIKRGTLYPVFGVCDTNINVYYVSEINIRGKPGIYSEIIAKKQTEEEVRNFEERFKKILSYVIYNYLSNFDFRPVAFVLFPEPLADIKKIYPAKITTSDGIILDAIACEFDNKGIGLSDNPRLYIVGSPNLISNSEFIELKVAGDDQTQQISFSLDGGVWSEWIRKGNDELYSLQVSNLLTGPHQLRIIGRNIFGNVNESPYKLDFYIDRTPPNVKFAVPQFSNKLKIDLEGKDDSGLEIFADIVVRDEKGKVVFKTQKRFLHQAQILEENINEGRFEVVLRFSDLAGNTSEFFKRWMVIDKTPPQIVPVQLPERKMKKTDVKIVIKMKDNFFSSGIVDYYIAEALSEGRMICFSQFGENHSKMINEPYGEIEIRSLEPNKWYHMCFRGRDLAGNVSPTFETDFFIDTTPPKVTVVSFPPRITSERNVLISFEVSDNISSPDKIGIFWELNPLAGERRSFFKGNLVNVMVSGLPDGLYRFSVYAVDEAGNMSRAEEVEFVVSTVLKKLGIGGGKLLSCQSSSFISQINIILLIAVVFLFYLIKAKGKSRNI